MECCWCYRLLTMCLFRFSLVVSVIFVAFGDFMDAQQIFFFFATLLLYKRIDWGDAVCTYYILYLSVQYTHIICIRFSIWCSDAVMVHMKLNQANTRALSNIGFKVSIKRWKIQIKNIFNEHVLREIGSSAPVKNP